LLLPSAGCAKGKGQPHQGEGTPSLHERAFFGLRIPARAGSIVHRNKAKRHFAKTLTRMKGMKETDDSAKQQIIDRRKLVTKTGEESFA